MEEPMPFLSVVPMPKKVGGRQLFVVVRRDMVGRTVVNEEILHWPGRRPDPVTYEVAADIYRKFSWDLELMGRFKRRVS